MPLVSELRDDVFGVWLQKHIAGGKMSIRLEVDKALSVVVDDAQGEVARESIPYPNAGFGGHGFVVSPDEQYVALFLYSGQSEVGYELFLLRPSLRHLNSLPYQYGEGYGPAFSEDGRWLALACATNPTLHLEECQLDHDGLTTGNNNVEWAQVWLQVVPDGAIQSCVVSLMVPEGTAIEGNDNFYPERLSVSLDGAVRFETAWGAEVILPAPLPSSLVIPGVFANR